ncbi:MAG: PRTRC system ThiF family protein [Bacteroidota bacterium]|jgi:PRTRC genetic system ThiF family protein|uniref:PRTRC system ThiF family protein n=4 Tax=Flagellimonas TaxID=444459 RepID=A0A371JVI5_9FLAO|nr:MULTISPECIES: PRTRC system ThiF family protein [Allomuricauda]MEC8831749.1 PRTRC system ThiF family protein [Bacteroidota bacterium]GMN05478.1 PRTRC system ThiF family protein [Croceitalea sp. MTPC5]MBO0340750.1 PRTRC system ThiF family protein [Allomuricauda profundi]MBO6534041.1 PRTRC system ThiF family protein [Allomuricauda sp.]MBO6589661.1 PRTRC system ThiF family protein [Allomuricauda sp.]|tara:strand:- start:1394 stop:2173 length:780 start_codon:yes stop_codon:yes gene_type:complete
MKTRIHFAPNYFYNPTHPITIALIGVGGTGSLMLARLARMDFALRQIGHPGLHIIAYDSDMVENNNVGRQLYALSDVGEYKVVNAVNKVNIAFGLQWEGIPMDALPDGEDIRANIIITCVDNARFRTLLSKSLAFPFKGSEYQSMFYWLDIGNCRDSGQFVLGTLFEEERNMEREDFEMVDKLKNIIDFFPDLDAHDIPRLQGAGCAYSDKLNEQSLFINDVLVAHASDCLFRLLYHKQIQKHGAFVNLESGKVNSILV